MKRATAITLTTLAAVCAVALTGAHCILVPTALGAEWDVVATRVIPARAFENGAYVAYANHAGREGKVGSSRRRRVHRQR